MLHEKPSTANQTKLQHVPVCLMGGKVIGRVHCSTSPADVRKMAVQVLQQSIILKRSVNQWLVIPVSDHDILDAIPSAGQHRFSFRGRLTSLQLCGTNLETLPECLGLVSGLSYLHVSHNQRLQTLNANIGELHLLKKFTCVRNNQLQRLPASFSSLSTLETLYCAGNNSLTQLPHDIGDLTGLKIFQCNGNRRLAAIPASFRRLPRLAYFECSHNATLKTIGIQSFATDATCAFRNSLKTFYCLGDDALTSFPDGFDTLEICIARVDACGVVLKVG